MHPVSIKTVQAFKPCGSDFGQLSFGSVSHQWECCGCFMASLFWWMESGPVDVLKRVRCLSYLTTVTQDRKQEGDHCVWRLQENKYVQYATFSYPFLFSQNVNPEVPNVIKISL